ncbi:MAG: DMT family transporter [Deltaproteobacteria bacterium]|nr:DMT family transporter [Deltaproteobacteria bacterium]
MKNRNQAILFLLCTAILWSAGGILIKSIQWHPMAICGGRSAIAAAFLLLVSRRLKWHWSWPQIGGGVAYAALVILFIAANKLTTAANAILIQYSAPIYIALFSNWFIGEKITRFDWLIIFIVLAGLTLFFVDEITVEGFWGNICALLSGVSLAWLFLFMRKQKDADPIESVIIGNILAAVVGIPFILQSAPGGLGWPGLVAMGIFQLAIPYWLFSQAIKHVTALEAVLIPILEPILNPIWVLLIVGETPGPWALVGGIIVLSTVAARGIVVSLNGKSASVTPL